MSRLLIVGCDPSSKKLAFYAQFGDRRRYARAAPLRKSSAAYSFESAVEARRVCQEVIEQVAVLANDTPNAVPYLFIEEPVVGIGGIKSSLVQAYINGVVQSCFGEAGYRVYIVHVSSWKGAFKIANKGGKQPVYDFMASADMKAVELCKGDGDLLDAAVLCRYGRTTLGL